MERATNLTERLTIQLGENIKIVVSLTREAIEVVPESVRAQQTPKP
jgi:hypothetical protein